MKNLGSFLTEYVSSKNNVNNKENIDEGKVYTYDGKKTKIKWGVDEPVDNDASDDVNMDSSENTDAMEDLIDKFEVEEPFFIVGEAGWGKTSTIKSLAKKYNRTVLTVYLDKAEAVDLGGIPVPVSGKMNVVADAKDLATGKVKKTEFAKQIKALPPWAALMLEHPETDYLLFFDEMNQAAPDVMNALMPIVLENTICEIQFDNFFVGAAGNFEHENESGINELSGPLKSRFKPLIVWESGTEKAWKQVFRYLHKKWDGVLGKDVVDEFEDKVDVFENPRELEQKVFQFMHRMKAKGSSRNDAARFARRLKNLAKEDLTRTQQNHLNELAETMFNFLTGKNDKSNEKSTGRSSRKDINMVDENIKKAIKQGMKYGYIEQEEEVNGKKVMVKYGISEENINTIEEWDSEDCNAEMRERLINKFKNDGIEFKFKTDAEWKKKGYKDPNAD